MSKQAGKEYQVLNQLMICPICKQSHFKAGQSLLDSKGATILGFDWGNPNADTFTCTSCEHMLWFLGSEIGARGKVHEVADQPLLCPLCKGSHFTTRQTLMSSKGATFMKMDWVNPNAGNYICTQCGFMLWFLPEEIGRHGKEYSIEDQPLSCIYCRQTHFTTRHTLLSSRGAVFMEMDWVNPEATNYTCTNCSFVHWFL